MAGKVTSVSVKTVAAAVASGLLVPGRGPGRFNVSEFCVEQNTSRKTFYKWVHRFRSEGLQGLEDRPRRPHRVPNRGSLEIADAVVRSRKTLPDSGLDHGPISIRSHLQSQLRNSDTDSGWVPSEATIWRILRRRGLITAQPRKRPRSSYIRFEASTPNEMWQIDHTETEWEKLNEGVAHTVNVIDDHSRVVIRSRAVRSAGTEQAWETFTQGTETWGAPTGVLSDNGLCFSGKLRHLEVYFEAKLRDLGIEPKVGRAYHPQTTGKVERFQQTLKKWLHKQPRAVELSELQDQLDRFCHIYNHHRPHQGIGRITPIQRWEATSPAPEPHEPLPHPHYNPDATSEVTVTNGCTAIKNYVIHIGAEYNGQPATVTLQGGHINVIINNQVVRHLTLDPTRRYQPSGRPRGGPPKPKLRSNNCHPSTATHL